MLFTFKLSKMRAKFNIGICCFLFGIFFCDCMFAQNSVLVNFGSNSCTSGVPSFSLIKDPLSVSPVMFTTCDMSAQLPDYFGVFISYNPLTNKIYIADSRTNERTDIWQLDMGLPTTIACPATISVSPTSSYSYVSNNFEFDNDGNLWSFSTYNPASGRCNIDKFDVNTGNIFDSKILEFPENHFPANIDQGDLTILPNGRMFAVLGSSPCQLYEITNYSSGIGNAMAIHLLDLPKNCYGIAFLNGLLELTGINRFSFSCYYYDYNITTGILGAEKPFQNGQAPIDNTSLTPQVGCSKKLLGVTRVNNNTADLVYELYLENMGNVILNNINFTDDLTAAFGAGNVSNVSVSAMPGSNTAHLTLNPAYNGTTVTNILNPGQNLPNRILNHTDYFLKLQVQCRATNLASGITYLNSAIATANIGAGNTATIINVSDSSNNGDSIVVDPNKNGNAGDIGENVPTPFNLAVLPVKFLNVNATLQKNNTALIQWQVATPMEKAATFEVEFSADGKNWRTAGELNIDNSNQASWQFTHINVPEGNLYYRIQQTDNDGTFIYSRIVLLKNKHNGSGYVIYPNPANNFIAISAGYDVAGKAVIELYDATGRLLLNKTMTASSKEINTALYPRGTYLLRLINDGNVMTYKVVIAH